MVMMINFINIIAKYLEDYTKWLLDVDKGRNNNTIQNSFYNGEAHDLYYVEKKTIW